MKRTVCRTARGAVSVLMLLVFFVPVYWMLLTAVKTMGQCYQTPPAFWVSNPAWDNFTRAFEAIPFWNMLKNSLIVTAGTLLCQCVTVIPPPTPLPGCGSGARSCCSARCWPP